MNQLVFRVTRKYHNLGPAVLAGRELLLRQTRRQKVRRPRSQETLLSRARSRGKKASLFKLGTRSDTRSSERGRGTMSKVSTTSSPISFAELAYMRGQKVGFFSTESPWGKRERLCEACVWIGDDGTTPGEEKGPGKCDDTQQA